MTLVAYYRPAYYYYSYTYNGYVYVGAYYGYTNSTMNMTAIIVPCAIIGTIFLMIVLSIVVGKCTNRDCCTACLCIFCCQCSLKGPVDPIEGEHHIEVVEVVEINDDNSSNDVEEIGGIDDKQQIDMNGYNNQYGLATPMSPNTSVISGYPMMQV